MTTTEKGVERFPIGGPEFCQPFPRNRFHHLQRLD